MRASSRTKPVPHGQANGRSALWMAIAKMGLNVCAHVLLTTEASGAALVQAGVLVDVGELAHVLLHLVRCDGGVDAANWNLRAEGVVELLAGRQHASSNWYLAHSTKMFIAHPFLSTLINRALLICATNASIAVLNCIDSTYICEMNASIAQLIESETRIVGA